MAIKLGPGTGPERPSAEPAPAVPDLVAGKTVSQVLGEVVWLLSRVPAYQGVTLGELEWMVMPPILLKQFRIHYDGDIPVRFEAWAQCERELTFDEFKVRAGKDAKQWRMGPHKVQVVDAALIKAAN